MKNKSTPEELTAALADKGVSLEALKQRIVRTALEIPTFNLKPDGTKGDWVSAKDADDTARAKWAGKT